MGAVHGVVVHGTRSGKPQYGVNGDRSEGQRTITYCLTPGTTSYNYLLDFDGTIYELVPPGTAAWHAQELNYHWLGVALAQAVDGEPATDEQYAALGLLLRKLKAQYGIPDGVLIWLAGPKEGRGVVEHRHTAQGQRWGKSDHGAIDWARVR